MKALQRRFAGLVASVLLSVGFVQAAERAERWSGVAVEQVRLGEFAAPNCAMTCQWGR